MSQRFPEPADPFEEQGLASPDPTLQREHMSGESFDDEAVPGDRPVEANEYGTTAAEQAAGEPLDLKLSRELPDVDPATATADDSDATAQPFPTDADERVGRLVQPDQGTAEDDEKDEVAGSVGTDQGGFSAEERAMHIDPEASEASEA